MRERLLILFGVLFLAAALIGLNAASYVQKDSEPDKESFPDRSTFNSGATGTRALFDLLSETGTKVSRWQEETSQLLTDKKNAPRTFVVIGPLLNEYEDAEIEQLFGWVSTGGRLVLIDREPDSQLLATTANWKLSSVPAQQLPWFDSDPSDVKQMTEKTPAAKPSALTLFTHNISAVQPSRYASSVAFEFFAPKENETGAAPASQQSGNKESENKDEIFDSTPPPVSDEIPPPQSDQVALTGPVVHLSNGEKLLLADFPFGEGRVVFLSDPYIVSNGGIALVDNAQLAINVLSVSEGLIAFDEYHHGYGSSRNRLLEYFSGTPVAAIILQLFFVLGAVLFTQSRRFARALPAERTARLAKLEYVSAMAELEEHTRAYDLAIENIFNDFRRRAARSVGLDPTATKRRELVEKIAERADRNPQTVSKLFVTCENIIHGEPSTKRETLSLITQIRELEKALNLKRIRHVH